MFFIELAYESPGFELARRAVEGIQITAANMPAGVARKTKQRQQCGVHAKHDRAQAQTETVGKFEGEYGVSP
jgi:hypothetical protein